jgi:hypothetical protein
MLRDRTKSNENRKGQLIVRLLHEFPQQHLFAIVVHRCFRPWFLTMVIYYGRTKCVLFSSNVLFTTIFNPLNRIVMLLMNKPLLY